MFQKEYFFEISSVLDFIWTLLFHFFLFASIHTKHGSLKINLKAQNMSPETCKNAVWFTWIVIDTFSASFSLEWSWGWFVSCNCLAFWLSVVVRLYSWMILVLCVNVELSPQRKKEGREGVRQGGRGKLRKGKKEGWKERGREEEKKTGLGIFLFLLFFHLDSFCL